MSVEKIVHLSNGHQMTEESLKRTAKDMLNKLQHLGAAVSTNIPESDIVVCISDYDADKFRHALATFRYKIVKQEGLLIHLNLY